MLAVVALSAVCGGPVHRAPASGPMDIPPAAADATPNHPSDEMKTSSTTDTSSPGDPAYTIRFKFKPEKNLFYLIDNQYRDSGGVPPLLAYSTWAKDRKTITQQVLPSTAHQPSTASATQPSGSYITWRCERYEAQEQGHKDKITYDSLRDSYPPPSLMDLGGIAGSRANFFLDPATGKPGAVNIVLTTNSGQAGRRSLSKTAEKCLWNSQTFSKLLDDLGPLYLPKGPVRIGDTWTHTYSEVMKTFGAITTQIHCTLRSVRPVEGRDLATIEITGDVSLIPESKPEEPAPATSRPTTTSAPAANKPRDFRIDHAACSGSVEFDLTRGELVQMTLRRDLAFVADVSSPNSGPMQLKSGSEHILRVKTSQTAPPRPIIVGGPKPPVVPPNEQETAGRPRGQPARARAPGITTRPVLPRPAPTTRPAARQARPTTTMPMASRPARSPRVEDRPGRTTRPGEPGIVNPRTPTSAPAWRPRPVTTRPTSTRPNLHP